ncbi:hypothetical protein C8R45DRAFT_1185800 [Mycena sanguinolenta]|nr:hypothetical protein C8R45DRAFT_1185800 [Mycena sanguinolenta]
MACTAKSKPKPKQAIWRGASHFGKPKTSLSINLQMTIQQQEGSDSPCPNSHHPIEFSSCFIFKWFDAPHDRSTSRAGTGFDAPHGADWATNLKWDLVHGARLLFIYHRGHKPDTRVKIQVEYAPHTIFNSRRRAETWSSDYLRGRTGVEKWHSVRGAHLLSITLNGGGELKQEDGVRLPASQYLSGKCTFFRFTLRLEKLFRRWIGVGVVVTFSFLGFTYLYRSVALIVSEQCVLVRRVEVGIIHKDSVVSTFSWLGEISGPLSELRITELRKTRKKERTGQCAFLMFNL